MSMQEIIIAKLNVEFAPITLEVLNEGAKHAAGAAAEKHFKVIMASEQFEGKNKVARHRMVYQTLSQELATQVHALALYLYTPQEFQALDSAPETPDCMGKGR